MIPRDFIQQIVPEYRDPRRNAALKLERFYRLGWFIEMEFAGAWLGVAETSGLEEAQ